MDYSKEQKLRDNLHLLINETNNEEEVLNILKQKNVINQAEFNDIAKAASPMGLKSQMFYLILKKDDYAYHHLIEAFKETGNDTCVGILTGTADDTRPPPPKIEVEVFVTKADDVKETTTPDHEGIAIADEIEKELDRIESEDDSRAESEASFASSEQQQQQHHEETQAQLAPAPKPRKGVSFDNKVPDPEETSTVKINGFEEKRSDDEEGEYDGLQGKSIVAVHREKFGGEGKFNKAVFAKRGLSLDREAEPESQVKNLKKYFQRLSSVEQR